MSTPIINVTQAQPAIIQPRMPVGPQGPKGDSAPEVKIQYSADNSSWHDTFQAGDIYMRISTDGGSTWTQGYKFIGEDGQDAPNVLIQFSPDNANWHTDYQQGDAYVRFSNDNGVTWTNGVPVAVNADTLDGYHASYFQAMIDQKVDEFIIPRNGDTVVWHKVGELTTDIGTRANNLTLLVSGVSDFGWNKPGVDLVQISTRGGVSVDVYSLTPPGRRSQTYGYVNNTSTGKTEIWVKRDTYTYETHFAVLNVKDDYGVTYGNLASSSTEPSGIVYVGIKTYWTSDNDGSGSGLDADTVDGFDASQTPGPNVIPVAASSGKLNVNWIPSMFNSVQVITPSINTIYQETAPCLIMVVSRDLYGMEISPNGATWYGKFGQNHDADTDDAGTITFFVPKNWYWRYSYLITTTSSSASLASKYWLKFILNY